MPLVTSRPSPHFFQHLCRSPDDDDLGLPSSPSSTYTHTYIHARAGKLKVVEYLDDFPFAFYVVLRDLSAMPEVVADALRQWFELIRSED